MKCWFFISLILMNCNLIAKQISLVPQPRKIVREAGSFSLRSAPVISYSHGAEGKASQLAKFIKRDLGFTVSLSNHGESLTGINLILDPGMRNEVAGTYRIQVSEKHVLLKAGDEEGLFYAGQTLLQLMTSTNKNGLIPAVLIEDAPNFEWRGVMLDVSRYFMTKEYVLRYLDMMAMHKLNVFHWHLIDDSGWRLEIKKYPKLTQVGAWRGKGKERNGGFYSQEDIREIVAYANERHIKVIPEIELPAHVLSAVVSYPELSCTGKQHIVPDHHFISRDLYCAGKNFTYEFLTDVMKEVFELFPSDTIHIGGDEAFYDRWKKCPDCQAKIKKEGLKNEKELQGYMTNFIEKVCMGKGRRIVGWDEILKCNVSKSAVLMVWRNARHSVEGAQKGHKIVQALTRHTYFDTAESRLPGEITGATWIPPVSLGDAYKWDPIPKGLTEEERKKIIGAQACLWTDQLLQKKWLRDQDENDKRSEVYVDMLTLPRMAALAEVTWSLKEQRHFEEFCQRMKRHYLRYESAGYQYRLPLPEVQSVISDRKYKFTAEPSIEGGRVHYTKDGSQPSLDSSVYMGPVFVDKKENFRAICVTGDGKRQSLVYQIMNHDDRYHQFGMKVGAWHSGQIVARKASAKSWNVTGKINGNGKYRLSFIYTGGAIRLDIDWVEILRNGKVVQRIDGHKIARRNSSATYNFLFNGYETGADFKVRAGIYGDTGTDSNGLVYLKKL